MSDCFLQGEYQQTGKSPIAIKEKNNNLLSTHLEETVLDKRLNDKLRGEDFLYLSENKKTDEWLSPL